MELEFHNNYVLAVIALLWGLCFCRNVLESLSYVVQALDRCVQYDLCCLRPCVDFCKTYGVGEVALQAVVLFCFLQPLIFCVIFMLNESSTVDRASSVIMHSIELNSSSLSYRHGNASRPQAHSGVAAYNLVEIDYIMLVLPFTMLVSVTSLLWVHCINARDLTADMTWDTHMPDSVHLYETVYYVEVWAMNVSFVAVMCSERSVLEVHFASMALTLMMVYVLAQSRHAVSFSLGEHVANILVSCAFFSVLVPVWLEMLQYACPVALMMACMHALIIMLLMSFHSFARGESTAGQVLLVRLACTIAACLAHIVVYAAGRNRRCLD